VKPIIKKILTIILVVLCLFLAICIIEPTQLDVNHITVKSSEIPAEFNGTTIELISDFHYGTYVNDNEMKNVVKTANEQNPDIIVLAGDYVTDDSSKVNSSFGFLRNLTAKEGIYAVIGNNDPYNATVKAIRDSGFNSMDNKGYWIEKNGAKIRIGGVGDLANEAQSDGYTLNGTTTNDFVIMTAHNPNYITQMNHNKVDLLLSGHTHGGQVNLFGFAPWVQAATNGKQYISGVYEEDGSELIVTNGVGEIKVPFRFMATPQITVITLESQ
jgi:predicted MPP superfamily phosphohydrolase